MTHPHEGGVAGTQPTAPPGDPDLDLFRPRSDFWLPSDRAAALFPDVHRPVCGVPVYGDTDLLPDHDGGYTAPSRGSVTVAFTIKTDGFLRGLYVTLRALDGIHGRRAPARGLVQKAARHRRNAHGFVPGAHPAARPMHEAYRARRRRRSGRR